MSIHIQRQTEYFIKDLHARETMRLNWYRHIPSSEKIKLLREKKAQHQAFLNDLLRRRSLKPIWYAYWLYWVGHLLGFISAYLPKQWISFIEDTLELRLLKRYQKYLKKLRLHFDLRSMIEAMQAQKLNHNEPGVDVLKLLEQFIIQEEQLINNKKQNVSPKWKK